jgi:hypothetical protein
MVLFTLISQIPLVPIRTPQDLVKRNKVTLMLGIAVYLTLGALIYTGKLPESITSKLPDYKILAGVILADLIIYIALHRFQYGLFPMFSIDPNMIPPTPSKKTLDTDDDSENDVDWNNERIHDEDTITNSLKQRSKQRKERKSKEPLVNLPVPIDDEEISEGQYLDDNDDNEPNEVSLAEQDFFQKNDKTVVENWDVEDFSNMEMA